MSNKSILIVEDEAIIAFDLRQQLEGLGYGEVRTAGSAEQALQMLGQRLPSLVLMDIRLNGPMDGVEAAAIIGREHRVPVVFLTSHADPATVQRAAETAAYGYLTKPFRIPELRAAIEVALIKAGLERRLREADRWYAATLRCVRDGVVVTGIDGRLRFMNPAAESLLGVSSDVAAGQDVAELVRFAANGDPPAPNAALRALREGCVIRVTHARRLLGAETTVLVDESAGPISDEDGEPLGAVLVLRDASERVRHDAELRASEQRFRNAFDFAPSAMALVSLDGRWIQVNDSLCRLLGHDAASLCGRLLAEVSAAQDFEHEALRLRELQADGSQVTQFEQRYRHRDGARLIPALVSVSLLRQADQPSCYLYQIHDLSAAKAATEQQAQLAAERVRAEASDMANRAKSEFLSRASHEMRTPLNAVLGLSQLIQTETTADPARTQVYIGHIAHAGRHLLAMVNDLLDLQRVAEGHLQITMSSVALATCLGETLELLAPMAAERRIVFEVDVAAGLRVRADETRLRQVLLNLGSNAVKYSRPGGTVECSARRSSSGRMQLAIRDAGIGMTPEQLQHLYEPFERLGQERTTTPGVGLGLVITRSLVEQMGGAITITSQPRQGTLVELDFEAG